MYHWPWNEGVRTFTYSSRSSTCSSPEGDSSEGDSDFRPQNIPQNIKRGRPRAEQVSTLILNGAISHSNIRCRICNRVFPREKSLQAHMRTHTGERPYVCDYPGCGKSFCQSGQLKTHQRLHTGEKPFACSIQGCRSRFTHANRHCPEHPYAALHRLQSPLDGLGVYKQDKNDAVRQWISRQVLQRQERQPTKGKKVKRDTSPVMQMQSLDLSKKSTVATPIYSSLSEQTDKWISAMALIELSQGVGVA